MDNNMVHIRFFNGANGVEAMDVLVNGVLLVADLAYGEYTQLFKAVPGIYNFELVPKGENSHLAYMEHIEFMEGMYTFATCGDLENLDFAIISQQIGDEMPQIRFANLIPFESVVDVEIDDENFAVGLMYKEASDIEGIAEGSYECTVIDANTEDVILKKELTIESEKYIGMIIGKIGSSDWPPKIVLTKL